MKKLSFFFITVLALGIGYISLPKSNNDQSGKTITVYQTKTCGCCHKWGDHLKANGFDVKKVMMDNISSIKKKYQVPNQISSCHTAIIDGYVIEGHVPAVAINKLISEKHSTKGIAVPGMPMGSPGMEGRYKEAYDVVTFDSHKIEKFMSF